MPFLNLLETAMNSFRIAIVGALLAATLGLDACTTMRGSSAMTASLSGASEVPPVAGSGYGSVDVKLNKETNLLSWTVTYAGLSGPATAAHFHGPAIAGANAGVVVPITGNLASPINGTATLTEAQVEALLAGSWYVNVHTVANPGGEVRGQVTLRP